MTDLLIMVLVGALWLVLLLSFLRDKSVRLKIGSIEIEARSVEDVEEILEKAIAFQRHYKEFASNA